MLILDVFLRYSSVTLLFLIAVLAIRDGRSFKPSIYIFLATITIAFMLLGTAPLELTLPQPFHTIVRFGDVGNMAFIWWMGLSIFQDDFRLRWWHWTVLALSYAACLPSRIMELNGTDYFHPLSNYGLDLIVLVTMGHLTYVALKGRADDLVEPRRRFRLYFVLAMIAATVSALAAENLLMATYPEFLRTLRCMIIFPLALWGVLWLTQFHAEKLVFKEIVRPVPQKPAIDPRDQLLLDKLRTKMDADKIYIEPGLTIRTLSEKLKTPEHRLRALINNGLGYRNFSTFLNQYRIEAIKAAFADPKNTRIPVLTIALDHGYNSLAPFNRAFRNVEGKTPTQYRQDILSHSD